MKDKGLLKLPATRWDRLVAVLEDVEAERSIDAPRIIDRAMKYNISDLELFYILMKRYQEKNSVILAQVVSLYALMSTWVTWIKQVQYCFDVKKGKIEPQTSRRTNTPGGVNRNSSFSDTDCALRSQCSSISGGHTLLTRNNTDLSSTSQGWQSAAMAPTPLVTPGGGSSAPQTTSDSGSRSGRGWQGPSSRSHRFRGGRGGNGINHHWCFDLGADWKWEGTLDFLRDGKLLCCLVEEALDHSSKLEDLQNEHRSHSAALSHSAYEILYPSLADIDRLGSRTPTAPSRSPQDGFTSLVGYLNTKSLTKFSATRRGKEASKTMRMIEQEGKNFAAAEQWVMKLNGMCEHFLGWDTAHHKKPFFDVSTLDSLVRPLNEDDVCLVHRLHWLAVALYRVVKDPSVIPPPPRISFILSNANFADLQDAAEENNELGLLIATKCSCLPHNSQVSVTLHNMNVIRLTHPTMQNEQMLPCTVVEGEAFAFSESIHHFLPVWSVFQYFIKKCDGISWYFEMDRKEQEKERLLLGTSSLIIREMDRPTSQKDSGSGAMFDLTMQSSTIRSRGDGIARGGSDGEPSGLSKRTCAFANSPSRVSVARSARNTRSRETESFLNPGVSTVRRGRQRRQQLRTAHPNGAWASAEAGASRRQPGGSDADVEQRRGVHTDPYGEVRCADLEKLVVEEEVTVRAGASDPVVVTPSCTISCSPSSQLMVTCETIAQEHEVAVDEELELVSESTGAFFSESCKVIRNFTASVVHESEQNGIAIFSHHFRVSGGPIGKGAFGAVYKALNLDTGRIVAVKQSRYSYNDAESNLNWREFQMWSMLPPHGNVITFYGASKEVHTHQLLLVMEYASGGSIVQLYHHFRPIPEPLFYDHAFGMALGLKHLHDHNVIHGDVKPENVLTRSDGSVAISDFGCSRFSLVANNGDSSQEESKLSVKKGGNSWQLFGTAAFMAPEVILNEPHLKSDVWAFACTLLNLWLGSSPWSGGDRRFSSQDFIPLMFYIANEEVVPFTAEQVQRTPRWLQKIASRAFERGVDQRCNMTEILSILTEYGGSYGH